MTHKEDYTFRRPSDIARALKEQTHSLEQMDVIYVYLNPWG